MENGRQGQSSSTELSPCIQEEPVDKQPSSSSFSIEGVLAVEQQTMPLTRRQTPIEKDNAKSKLNGATKGNGSVASRSSEPITPMWTYILLVLFAVITIVSMPTPLHPARGEKPSIRHVFYYGWLTAISTGLGALPFYFIPRVGPFWVGVSNGTCSMLLSCGFVLLLDVFC
jgi:zinc transporter, ZIP family